MVLFVVQLSAIRDSPDGQILPRNDVEARVTEDPPRRPYTMPPVRSAVSCDNDHQGDYIDHCTASLEIGRNIHNMAPDLNSVPSSPHILSSSPHQSQSRRASSNQMAAPNNPLNCSPHVLPSNQPAVGLSSATESPTTATAPASSNAGLAIATNESMNGPGPIRHPRPLTAADLHLQLEKEQEAVVNRLTRELSLLRAAHNASVASTASSTSLSHAEPLDPTNTHMLSGPSHPAPAQRPHHRSSSSASTRSIPTLGSLSTVGGVGSSSATSVAPERSRPTAITSASSSGAPFMQRQPSNQSQSHNHGHTHNSSQGQSLSRQNSAAGSRRSGASSPGPWNSTQGGSWQHEARTPGAYITGASRDYHRDRERGGGAVSDAAGIVEAGHAVSPGARYEELLAQRHELDHVRRENDMLKRRIRELERTLRDRRTSDASVSVSASVSADRARSESVSTTASVAREAATSSRGRDREDRELDDVVGLGESARSRGIR